MAVLLWKELTILNPFVQESHRRNQDEDDEVSEESEVVQAVGSSNEFSRDGKSGNRVGTVAGHTYLTSAKCWQGTNRSNNSDPSCGDTTHVVAARGS